jgi:DNA polymerase III delta prime subunit
MNTLWVEKYRPNTLDGYVFRDANQKAQIEQWVKSKSIPHLLFSGAPGVGKTTLAKILLNLLEVEGTDILEINASRENSVDVIRDKITNFVQTMPFGEFKVVLLDEADYISPNGQAALRGVMEMYHQSARFILTCNYPNRVIPALHSRCQGFHIEKIDKTEFTARAATILVEEGIEFELDVLDTYVKATYPDLRKCINTVQMNSADGQLQQPNTADTGEQDYKIQMVELFKAGRITDARKLICSQARPEEMEEIYKWMYDNIEIFGDTEDQQDEATLVIKQGLVDHSFVAEAEINLSATLIKLARIQNASAG